MRLAQIPIELLKPHPDNPRLFLREEVVEGIRKQIEANGFEERHAPHVREVDSHYQLISGHQRREAAARAGLEKIPCIIVEMDDETTFHELLLSNTEKELEPLEKGLHILKDGGRGKGGRGKKGGISFYAERMGVDRRTAQDWVLAADVVTKHGGQPPCFVPYAASLSIIHRADEGDWANLAERMLAGGWKEDQTKRYVDETKALEMPEELAGIFPRAVVLEKYFLKQDLAQPTILKIAQAVRIVEETIRNLMSAADAELEIRIFREWLRQEGARALDVRAIHGQGKTIIARIERAAEIAAQRWNLGNWQDHVDALADDSIALVLTDPPYGMDYYGNRPVVKEAAPRIANDETIESATQEIQTFFKRVFPKLKADCHVLVFCHPEGESAVAAALEAAGLTRRRRVIWVKDQLGMGDLERTFAPSHEVILHAVKGDPMLLKRERDSIVEARVTGAGALHPAEKPLALLIRLIQATTVEGELVIDPFGGVASTLVAAKQTGRAYWGCELNDQYFEAGQRRLLEDA